MNTSDKNQNQIWHPFTQMKTASAPIHIESAKGTILYDKNGNTYIDAISSWWVNIHGHSHPLIAERIAKQAQTLEHVIFAGFIHTPAIELANRLLDMLGSDFSKIFYSDNGSTSVEVAIKMALQYWHNKGIKNKKLIIAFENAYHGDTFGAMSVGGKSTFNQAFQDHLFDVLHLPLPHENNIHEVTLQFEQVVKEGNVAAFIFEPLIQGAAGMITYEKAYLDSLIKLAKENEVICIADEVMTGFGRTGKTFAMNYLAEVPDIICLSKGITGGFMPLGVTACAEFIYDAFYADDKEKTFYHGHSYTANPLACTAACASMSILLEKKCQDQIQEICISHTAFISQLIQSPSAKNVRQIGTILAFELVTNEGTSYFNPIRNQAYQYFMERGVLLRPLGNVIYIMPPYCITNDELTMVYGVIIEFLNSINS